MKHKPDFSIEDTIIATSEALKVGIISPAIRLALQEHGFKKNQIEVMIRWAERKNMAA